MQADTLARMSSGEVDALIAVEEREDAPTVAATLEVLRLDPRVRRVTVSAPVPMHGPGDAQVRWLEPATFEVEAWRASLEGRHALVVAGAAALLPGTLGALLAAVTTYRFAAASAWSAGGRLLVTPSAVAGPDGRPGPEALALAAVMAAHPERITPIGAAEPSTTLFRADALGQLPPLDALPATALVERLSFDLSRVGLLRVATPRALVATRAGWRSAPSADPAVALKHEALRRADARRRAFLDVARLAPRGDRRPRVALDLTGIPWRQGAMNGTQRFVLAAVRALDEGLATEVELDLVVDDEVAAGVAPGRRRVVGLDDVADRHYDAALRPTAFQSPAAVLELARASRSFSLVVLDLIAVLLEDLGAHAAEGAYDPTHGLDQRATLDLALELCRRAHAIGPSARDELTRYVDGRPGLAAKLGWLPLADLRVDAAPVSLPALEGRPFLLWVGNGHPHKRLEECLAAWRAVEADLPGVRLVLLGGRPELATERVVVLRDVGEGHLRWLYRAAAAVVSTSSWEGFGLPALEAALDGGGVVAARTPQTEHVLGPDHPGLYTTRAELAERLRLAVSDPARLRRAPALRDRSFAAFQAALVADVREALDASPPTAAPGPLDAAALLGAPRSFPAPSPGSSALGWLSRELERRSPLLARVGRRALGALRR